MSDLDSAMRQYYARRAPEYDDWYDRLGRYDDPATNHVWQAELAALERFAAAFGAGHLLDIACGTGRWTVHFAANPAVSHVTALDQAPEMLTQTQSRLRAAGLDASLVLGDAYVLPFPDHTFDSAFFGFFLSHVPLDRVSPFLAEVRHILRPGGQVLLFDSLLPAGRPTLEVQDRPLKDGSHHPVLKVYYTPDTLAAALASCAAPGTIATGATGRFFVVGRAVTP